MTIPRCGLLILLLFTTPAAPGTSQEKPPGPNNILLPSFPKADPLNEAVFLAFDTVSFPERKNVSLELIPGRNPRRVIPTGPKGSHDELWGYFTILRIGDRFHLWVMTQSVTPSAQYLCYATSKDGIEWEKPELGLVEYDGSKKNNIIESPFKLRSPTCEDILTTFLVHFDPEEANPERRYKMAAQLIQGGGGKLAIAYSPDGLRWKARPEPKPQFMEMGGSIKFKGQYYMTGQSTMPRRLNVFASTDFEKWTDLGSGFARDHLPTVEKEEPSPLPDADKWAPAGIGKGEQVHCGAGLWNRGNVILGVYDAWHGREKDRRLITMDLGLVVSHDAVKYTEPVPSFRLVDARKQPAVPPHGPALTGGKLQNIGDKTHCWYTWWHPPEGRHGTYAVTWDRDRLGLLKPDAATGASVVSAPIRITEGSAAVYVNASGLDKDNRLRISLLDEKGQPIAGFSGAAAATLDKDGLRIPVTWKGGPAIAANLQKVQIQVAFEGAQGRLHAVYVAGQPLALPSNQPQHLTGASTGLGRSSQ